MRDLFSTPREAARTVGWILLSSVLSISVGGFATGLLHGLEKILLGYIPTVLQVTFWVKGFPIGIGTFSGLLWWKLGTPPTRDVKWVFSAALMSITLGEIAIGLLFFAFPDLMYSRPEFLLVNYGDIALSVLYPPVAYGTFAGLLWWKRNTAID